MERREEQYCKGARVHVSRVPVAYNICTAQTFTVLCIKNGEFLECPILMDSHNFVTHIRNIVALLYLKSLHGSVVRIHHELREGGELGGPVPPVATVHQRVASLQLHVASYHGGALHEKRGQVPVSDKN